MERLKRKHNTSHPCDHEISCPEELEFRKEVIPDNLDRILTGERQYLKQIQADIDLHRDEHLQDLYIKAHDDRKKSLETILAEMKHRERQQRAWQKIQFTTK